MAEGDANGFTKCRFNSCENDNEAAKVMGYIISEGGFSDIVMNTRIVLVYL